MSKLKLVLFIKTKKVSTSSADTESLGHACASPMRTGAYDRMGSEMGFLSNNQLLLLDAANRACKRMKWNLEIVDVSKYSLMKRIKEKEPIPRLECEGKVMTGTPTSDEIIQVFNEKHLDSLTDRIESKLSIGRL